MLIERLTIRLVYVGLQQAVLSYIRTDSLPVLRVNINIFIHLT
jgi:hypothetical protein